MQKPCHVNDFYRLAVLWMIPALALLSGRIAVVAQDATAKQESAEMGESLIKGGSLDGELLDSGLPAGWGVYPERFEGLDCYTTTEQFHSEPRGLKLTSKLPWAQVSPGLLPKNKGTMQAARAWVKRDPGASGEALIIFYYRDESGKNTAFSKPSVYRTEPATNQTKPQRDGSWQLLALESSGDAFPETTSYEIVAVQKYGGVTFWDDFEVRSYPVRSVPNLLENGDFESVADVDFAGWKVTTSEGSQIQVAPEITSPSHGWTAFSVSGKADKFELISSPIAIAPNKTYRLNGQHRSSVGEGEFKLVVWNGDERRSTTSTKTVPSKDWSALKEVVVLPEATTNATHLTLEYSASGSLDLAIDDLTVTAQ